MPLTLLAAPALALLLPAQPAPQAQAALGVREGNVGKPPDPGNTPSSGPMYRWRDAQGQEHVTSTPPPPGARLLASPEMHPSAPVGSDATLPASTAKEDRAAIITTLDQLRKTYWEGIETRSRRARAAGDLDSLDDIADSILLDALWGHGLWAVAGIPGILMIMGILAGWWLGSRHGRFAKVLCLFLGILSALGLSHVAVTRFLYRTQAQRLRLSLTLLPHFLGNGVLLRPENRQALTRHIQTLEAAASPRSAPWIYPLEILSIQETLRRVVAHP